MTNQLNQSKVIAHIFSQLGALLKPVYTYHALSHTTMVMRDATFLAVKMGISEHDLLLLQIAICLHDYGFIQSHENHESRGCEIARDILPNFDITPSEIEKICGMIMATKIPQSPKNELERIICDADLFYLGTTYYFQVAALFKTELDNLGILKDDKHWLDIQVNFLQNHKYHTTVAIELLEANKQNNLSILQSSN